MIIWVMSWLYPILTALLFVLAILMVLTWLWKDRQRVILWIALLQAVSAISLGLLSIGTGNHPVIDIDVLRSWIVASRFVLLAILVPCIYFQYQRLKK